MVNNNSYVDPYKKTLFTVLGSAVNGTVVSAFLGDTIRMR
jgi:hypothetical protein